MDANIFDPLMLHHKQVSEHSNYQREVKAANPDVNVKKLDEKDTTKDSYVVGHGEKVVVGYEVYYEWWVRKEADGIIG